MEKEQKTNKFIVGDFVYYEPGCSIGKISDITLCANGKTNYRIYYCQFKDPDRGVIGGNGPISRDGYPKEVTELDDVLFVAAMKEREKIKKLQEELDGAQANFNALKKSQRIIKTQK